MGIDLDGYDKDTMDKLILHIMLEKIDNWLWKTEDLSSDNDDRLISFPQNFDDDLKKLQYYSTLLDFFNEMKLNNESEDKSILLQYIGLILSTNVPIYDNHDGYNTQKLDVLEFTLNSKTLIIRKDGKLFKQIVITTENDKSYPDERSFKNYHDFIKYINISQMNDDIESIKIY